MKIKISPLHAVHQCIKMWALHFPLQNWLTHEACVNSFADLGRLPWTTIFDFSIWKTCLSFRTTVFVLLCIQLWIRYVIKVMVYVTIILGTEWIRFSISDKLVSRILSNIFPLFTTSCWSASSLPSVYK